MRMPNPFPHTVPQWVTAILFMLVVFFLGTYVTSVWGMDGRLHNIETWKAVHSQEHEQIMDKLDSIEDALKRIKP